MYNPLVSIIIPVYNGSNYLKESIESALAQTYKNIEVIVVNDGSSDEGKTENIAISYGDKIRYFLKENGGVATALNYGIEKMNGDWFSWLSHDDLYLPTKIESQISKLVNNDFNKKSTIISCKTGLIKENGEAIFHPKKFYEGFYCGEEMFKELCNGRILGGCSLLIPKIALEKVGGFSAEYRFIQDWVCWVELALKNNDFYLYEEELVKSRVHGNQDTIRLARLQPIEVNNYLNKLLYRLSNCEKKNNYYIKTVLFYYCTTKKNKEIRKKYINKLKEKNTFKMLDIFKYSTLLIRGQTIRISKKVYRHFVNRNYRGDK